MRIASSRKLLLATAALAGWAGVALAAGQTESVLGSDGEIYRVLTGSYGELFPGGQATEPSYPVLALEIVPPGGSPARSLVPDTESFEYDESPWIAFEPRSESLLLVWQQPVNNLHPQLNFRRYANGSWSEVIEVSGSAFQEKRNPRLQQTRDRFAQAGSGNTSPTSFDRAVVHLAWTEDTQDGPEIHYAPLVLVDGEYIGSTIGIAPGELSAAAIALPRPEVPASLQAPSWQAGTRADRQLLTFVNGDTGRLTVMELRLVPGELSELAGKARGHIVWRKLNKSSETPQELADAVRAFVLGAGRSLHPAVTGFLADQVRQHLVENASLAAEELAEQVATLMVARGTSLLGDEVSATLEATAPGQLLFLDDPRGFRHELVVREVATFPMPAVEAGPVSLHVARNGQRVIVAWSAADRVSYRESTPAGDGWSAIRTLALGPDFDRAAALRALDQRVQSH